MKIVQRVVSLTLAVLGLGMLGFAPSTQAAVPEGSVSKDCLVKTIPCVLDTATYKWGNMNTTKPDAEWACLFKGVRLADVVGMSATSYRAYSYNKMVGKAIDTIYPVGSEPTAEVKNFDYDGFYFYTLAEDGQSATFQVQHRSTQYSTGGVFGIEWVKLEQRGADIWGAVVGLKYWFNGIYGQDATTKGQSNTCLYYYDDDVKGSEYKVLNFSLQDLRLWYYAGSETLNVTFVDGDDQVIATRTVDRGEPAEAPSEAEMVGHVPEGYVLAGWDVSFSKIYQDTTVKALYHKLYTVTFQNPDGTVIDTQKVEETKAAVAPDMADRTYEDMPFRKWDVNFASVTEDLVVTAIYANTVELWKKADVVYPLTGEEIVMFKNLDITAISKVKMDVFHRYWTGSDKGQGVYASDEAPLSEGQNTGSGIYSYVQDETTGAITFEFRGINHNTSYSGLVSAFKWTMWQDGADVKGKMLWFKGGAYANQHLDKPSWDSVDLTYQVTDGMASDKSNYAAKVNSFEAFVEVPASYMVTFCDRDGKALKTQNVLLGLAATAPEVPEIEGFKFAGWDADFSAVESVLEIHPIYHRLCTVRFLDADGSVLKTQTVEQTLAAEAPDMTGKTYDGNPFKGWNAEFDVITGDLDVTAVYGILPSSVKKAVASGLLEGVENALIWCGGDGIWDLASANWSTPKGMESKWRADAIAIFAENATVAVSGAVTVGEIRTVAEATVVTFTGDAITFVAPAKVSYGCDSTIRFENHVNGEAGFVATCRDKAKDIIYDSCLAADTLFFDSARDKESLKTGPTASVVWFKNVDLSRVNGLRGTMYAVQGSATQTLTFDNRKAVSGSWQTKAQVCHLINDGTTLTAQFQMGAYYDYAHCVKIELTQVGNDVEGRVLYWKHNNNGVIGDDWDEYDQKTGDPARITDLKLIVEDVLPATVATEIAGDYRVTGELNVVDGAFKTVGTGTLFGGDWTATGSSCTSPVILGDRASFEFHSTATQTFANLINARNNGNDYGTLKACATAGRVVVGVEAQNLTFNCTSEGLHRVFNQVDVYGKLTLKPGTYHLFNANGYGVHVYDGGSIDFGKGNGRYGVRDLRLTCHEGAEVRYNDVCAMGQSDNSAIYDAATAKFTKDYTADLGNNIAHPNVTLKNGAEMTGVMMTWAWNYSNNKLTVDGTSPSSVTIEKIRVGQNNIAAASGKKMLQTLDVKDVTGDAAVDLTVSSSLYRHANATCADGNEEFFGLVKQGAGTLEFTGASPDYGASLAIEAGAVNFGPEAVLNGSKLFIKGNVAMDIPAGAKVAFGAIDLPEGKTLALTGVLKKGSLKVGADKNALSAAQLAQITYEGKTGKVYVDAEGNLCANAGFTLLLR